METGGAWIFLSHSNQDFDAVRRLRNELEAMGHHPLLFFLKCMDDNSELDDLVRREIEAREWFLLCDSPNSRLSRWVQREVEIITSAPHKVYTTVDLTADLASQLKQTRILTKRATVYLSYSHQDRPMADEIKAVLHEHDFAVWDPIESLRPSDNWGPVSLSALKDAAERGFV